MDAAARQTYLYAHESFSVQFESEMLIPAKLWRKSGRSSPSLYQRVNNFTLNLHEIQWLNSLLTLKIRRLKVQIDFVDTKEHASQQDFLVSRVLLVKQLN